MKTKPRLTKEALEFFRQAGARGGKKSSAGMTEEQRSERAKKAVTAREMKRKHNRLTK